MTVDRLRVRTRYARRWLRRRHDRLAPRQRQCIALAALLLFISGLILSTLQEKDKRDFEFELQQVGDQYRRLVREETAKGEKISA